MKRIFLTLTGCLIASASLFSQTDSIRFSAFKFGFIYPIGTNGAKYSNGVSLNILSGVSHDERILTLSGLASIVHNNISGCQLAGLYNRAGNNGCGLAMAGLANTVGNNYTGFLMAGLMNRTGGNMTGAQMAGLVNTAQNVNGAQIAGLVNRAKTVKGVQLAGLLNMADSSDYPLALVNIIKRGEKSVALSYSETGSAVASFRSGGRVTYGIIGLGYNHNAGKRAWLIESGLGAHISCTPRFRINSELTVENFIKSKKPTFKTSCRLHAAYRLLPHLEVFGGPGISYMQTNDAGHASIFPRHSLWKRHNGDNLRQVFIGYRAGVQYVF
jgi:hypothetical protein